MPKFRQNENKDSVQSKLHIQPSSAATNCIHALIEAGREGINELPQRQRQVNHSMKCTVEKRRGLIMQDDELSVEFKNSLGYVLLEMPCDYFDTLTGEFKSNVKKMFQFVLEKVTEQALRDGELIQDTVTFSGHELIDIGFYSSYFSGDRGLDAAMSILTSIKVKGEIRYSPKMKPVYIHSLTVMFHRTQHNGSDFTVFLNSHIDWQFIIYFISHMPVYYYELSSRAASLAYQIFYLARQNTDKIKAEGKFTISLKAVRNALSIPLRATKHAKRDIMEAFFRAVDEVEAAHKKHFNNSELELFIINCDTDMTPAQFIEAVNKGGAALEVNITGSLAKPFIDFEEKKEAKLMQAVRRARAAKARLKA